MHCNAVQCTVTHCNALQHTHTWQTLKRPSDTLQHTATHCNTLQYTHTRHTLKRPSDKRPTDALLHRSFFICAGLFWHVSDCNTPPRTATHCNILQHKHKWHTLKRPLTHDLQTHSCTGLFSYVQVSFDMFWQMTHSQKAPDTLFWHILTERRDRTAIWQRWCAKKMIESVICRGQS